MNLKKIRGVLGYLRRLPARVMRDLRYSKYVKSISNSKPKIYYFGVPEHSNLGDLAQMYCIRKYLEEFFHDYIVIEVPSRIYLDNVMNMKNYFIKTINPNDIILFQSGYCTQDIGGREDYMHQAVIRDYPNNRMIMMPQTVFFKSKEREKAASDVYNSHKRLLFLARDNVSYNTAKRIFPNLPVQAFPDIVTTLIGQYSFDYPRSGILFCLRNDSEKYYSDEELTKLMRNLEITGEPQDKLDTTIKDEYYVIIRKLKEYIEGYLKKFAHYKLVITDRYHGTIFSLIANTPVIVIQTTDHKVKTGVDWFKGVYDSQVYFAESLDKVLELSRNILQHGQNDINTPYFKEKYYSKLRDLILKL